MQSRNKREGKFIAHGHHGIAVIAYARVSRIYENYGKLEAHRPYRYGLTGPSKHWYTGKVHVLKQVMCCKGG